MNHDTSRTEPLVLQVGGLPPAVEAALRTECNLLRLPELQREEFLGQRGAEPTVAVTTGTTGVSGSVMRSLPNLRAIINFGVGYETTDIDTARELGIAVSNTPDVLTDCVADLAVGLLIDTLRQISASDRFIRRGQWPQGPFGLGTRVRGKRVGLLGLGRIGRATAARLEAFGAQVSYHSRNPVSQVAYPWYASVVDLARDSDVLIVAVSGGPQSAGLVSAEVLAALGPAGYLINISRGAVIDEPALVDALVHRTIAGAGLDVFVDEPHVPEALLSLDNVVLVPHLGSATVETREEMAELFMNNLRQFLNAGTLITPVY